jgi:threonine aldolase
MDGARFGNALSALNCTAADMTWKAGVDAVTFGCTKNGLMGVEAVIFFNNKHARELNYEEREQDICSPKIDTFPRKCLVI